MWKETVVNRIKVTPRRLPAHTEKYSRNPSQVRLVSNLAEIQTDYVESRCGVVKVLQPTGYSSLGYSIIWVYTFFCRFLENFKFFFVI